MFIEKHVETINEVSVPLVFIKSTNIQAYPCGRRRSSLVSDGSRIPFDPEARLNTEANNRKHSGLNGFTQTYLKNWDEANKLLSLSLAGYLFNITLPETYLSVTDPAAENYGTSEDKFGKTIVTKIEDDTATKIYANILIEDAQLFSGFQDYFTGILRDQVNTYGKLPEDSLDLLAQGLEQNEYNSYYFSGLSFSTKPLTAIAGDTTEYTTYHEKSYSFDRDDNVRTRDVKQTFVSLCILEKSGSTWKIHEPARLPFIEHDTLEDSIVVGETRVRRNLKVEQNATINNKTTTVDLEVTNEAAVRTTLNVQNTSNNAQANIDRADIEYADIDDTDISTAHIDNATIDSLTVPHTTGDATTITDAGINTQYIDAAEADIAVLKVQGEGSSATIDTANVTTELHVENEDGDAKASIDSADLRSADIEAADIDEADITTLRVQGDGSSATIDSAIITDAEVTNKVTTKDLESTGIILANKIGDAANKVENIIANAASIDTLTADTVNANDIQQKIDGTYKDVPVIFVQPQKSKSTNKTEYQLQIRRVNFLTEQQID